MVSLFDSIKEKVLPSNPGPTIEEKVNEDFYNEARMRQEDNTYVKPKAAPITELEQRNELITPSLIPGDPYHEKLVKEMVLGQTDKAERHIGLRYIKLINRFTHDGLTTLANIYHTELMTRLMLSRSEGGFQQNVWNKSSQTIERVSRVENGPIKKVPI